MEIHKCSFMGALHLGASMLALLLSVCPWPSAGAATYAPSSVRPPKPEREFRGAWIATVNNIDWPSSKSLTTAQQKAELTAMLDRAQQLKLNVVIFQVRPACDALYPSSIEPWSEYLTGTMGQRPEPLYDPLAFVIEEAHKRGLELHAWFNPFRAKHSTGTSAPSANHVSRTRPELVRKYGSSMWLDPGERAVQEYSLRVVMDVVSRYDIDGVHFDDYFYPYKERDSKGAELDFPDEASWKKSGVDGKVSRDDWRRKNVDSFLQKVDAAVHQAKPWMKFGISPFGIWRPGHPAQVQGLDAYGVLYADSRKWLNEGALDYFAPQLYWAIDSPNQSFPLLLKWWAQENKKRRVLAPGISSSRTLGKWSPQEITRQIEMTRREESVSGHVHWNMKSLMGNSGLASALPQVYSKPALVPAMPWLRLATPPKPTVEIRAKGNSAELKLSASAGTQASCWVLQRRDNGKWTAEFLSGRERASRLSAPLPEAVAVSIVDRAGNQSRPAVYSLRPDKRKG